MADAVFIDIPMDGEEVVYSFHFQERTSLSLQFGYDKLGLEFGQLQDSTPQSSEITNNNNTHTTTQTESNFPQTNSPSSSPSNSPIVRHKINLTKNLNNIRKPRPSLIGILCFSFNFSSPSPFLPCPFLSFPLPVSI
jgi:hypothetical protein